MTQQNGAQARFMASEADIQKAIIDFLNFNGCFCWKVHTTGIPNGKGGFRKNPSKGVSDILGVLPNGQALAIEVKRAGNQTTEDQQAFIDRFNGAGGKAFVAHSIDDVRVNLHKYF